MSGYSKKIEDIIKTIPCNELIIASELYSDKLSAIPELTYYKTLERLSKRGELVHLTKGIYYRPNVTEEGVVPITKDEIVRYYVDNSRGVVVGSDLYNKIGITNHTIQKTEILSDKLSDEKKNIADIQVKKISLNLNNDTIRIIKILDILQNYNKIEQVNDKALMRYLSYFLKFYSDEAANYVIENKKYKKSTIAFLVNILEQLKIKNSLRKYLSPLSDYKVPILKKEGKDMPDKIAEVVNGFSNNVSDIFGNKLSKIVLYGSYARGDYRDNSDVDIMILVKMPEEDILPYEEVVYDLAFDIEMETGVDISPIVKNKEHFEYWVDTLPFYRNVRDEGIVING